MKTHWPTGYAAEIDPGLTGVSFVDILFALAIGATLDPVEQRVAHPATHQLPASNVLGLVIALTLVLASFIGYHNSSSKPRFKIRFVNSSFIKFTLDMLMVITYFVLAATAARQPIDLKSEVSLICISFFLYVCWDLVSFYESHRDKYMIEWVRAWTDHDISDKWVKFNPRRMIPTWVCLVLLLLIRLYLNSKPDPLSYQFTLISSLILISIIFGYRVSKDLLSHRAKSVEDSSA